MWLFRRNRADATEGPKALPPLQRRRLGYLCFSVRDSTLEDVQPVLEKICEELVRRDYLIMSLASSVGIATIADGADDLEKTAKELIGLDGVDARIVYGWRDCMVGVIGGSAAFQYGAIIPNFSEVLKALLGAEFGSVNRVGQLDELAAVRTQTA